MGLCIVGNLVKVSWEVPKFLLIKGENVLQSYHMKVACYSGIGMSKKYTDIVGIPTFWPS